MAIITQEQIMDVMSKCYQAALDGLPGSKSCEELAREYVDRYKASTIAAKELIKQQLLKCSVSGFITGFGGLLTLPVTVPANVASVLYVQMRMIAALAAIGGYDVHSDEVQTLVYLCLVGSSLTDVVKSTGIKIANKVTTNMLKKLPGAVLTKINQKVGFRLLTKFGTKGAVNLVKVVPVAGALVGAGIDYGSTKLIADKAYNAFLLGKIE